LGYKYLIGFATVSATGLLFNGLVYTNAKMIKYKWFEHAAIDGEWQIPIFYQPQDISKIILFDLNAMEVATTVRKPSESHNTLGYQDALRNLKEQILQVKKHD
jgi:hypothetical protein